MFLKPAEERTAEEDEYTLYGICHAVIHVSNGLHINMVRPANSVCRHVCGHPSIYYWPIRHQFETPYVVPWERKYDLMRAEYCDTLIAEYQQQIKDHAITKTTHHINR